jgi:hypothetical protein
MCSISFPQPTQKAEKKGVSKMKHEKKRYSPNQKNLDVEPEDDQNELRAYELKGGVPW